MVAVERVSDSMWLAQVPELGVTESADSYKAVMDAVKQDLEARLDGRVELQVTVKGVD